jgi:hypothetical protein
VISRAVSRDSKTRAVDKTKGDLKQVDEKIKDALD